MNTETNKDPLKAEVMRRYVADIERALENVAQGLEVTEENIQYVTHVIVNNLLIGYGQIRIDEIKAQAIRDLESYGQR